MSRHYKECAICKTTFKIKPSESESRHTCSRECKRSRYQQVMIGENNPNWRGGKVRKQCLECEKEFFVIPAVVNVRKYCSRACRALVDSRKRGSKSPSWKGGPKATKRRYRCKAPNYVPRLPKKRKRRLCKGCGRDGVKKGSLYHPQCRHRGEIMEFACLDCGKRKRIPVRPDREQKRCRPCDYKTRKGKGNSNWKGGITSKNKIFRRSKEYKEWRAAVFERDKFTCVWCGQVGGQLNADHIKPFSQFPKLRLDVNNGRTLCVACHKMTDSYLAKVLGKSRREFAYHCNGSGI